MLSTPRVPEQQAVCKLTEACDNKGYKFLGWVDTYKSLVKSLVKVYCDEHSYTWEVTGAYVIKGRASCPECFQNKRERKIISDEEYANIFRDVGGYMAGTTFKRCSQGRQRWEVTCPVCMEDEYVKEGLCSGVFNQAYSSIISGHTSCRCSEGFRWTKSQREYQINKTITTEKLNYIFVGWESLKTTGDSAKIIIKCLDHGIFKPFLDTYLNNGSRCPDCAINGFKPNLPAYIYIIQTNVFTGYGITKNLSNRIGVHKKNLKNVGDCIKELKVFHVDGKIAQQVEKLVSRNFTRLENNVTGFIRESTNFSEYVHVCQFVENEVKRLSEVH